MARRALLVLEDGACFSGEALAGGGSVGGELVFNTSMTGYQEIATDPSYAGQLVTYTFPMNGDYGADPDRDESGSAHARAILTRELTNYRFNHDSSATWLDWLGTHEVLAVSGVDTRALTRHLRDRGAMRGVLSTASDDVRGLRRAAQALPSMSGLDLVKSVTTGETYEVPSQAVVETHHVVVYDYGVKRSMVRLLGERGFRLTVVPAGTTARDVLKLRPDGVFLSNGPGDPAAVTYGVKAVGRLLGKVPLFGICLGHQILALALGMTTYKLKFGHRGANHPVRDLRTGTVEITTQNHGFAVRDEGTAHPAARVTHVNLNDDTVEGLAAPDLFAFSVQYHPEAAPGPHDSLVLFDRFAEEMRRFAGGSR
jgi:carbamoyl-phosphate synthase small subunit